MKKNIIKFTLLLTLVCRGVLGGDEQGRLLNSIESSQSMQQVVNDAFDAFKLAVDASGVLGDSNKTLEDMQRILNNLRYALAGENGSTITPGTTRALDTLEDGEETLALTLPFQHTSENLAILEILRQFMVQHTKVRLEIDNTSLNVTPVVEGRKTMDIASPSDSNTLTDIASPSDSNTLTLKFASTFSNRVMLESLRQLITQHAKVQFEIHGTSLNVTPAVEVPATMGTAQEFIPDPYGRVCLPIQTEESPGLLLSASPCLWFLFGASCFLTLACMLNPPG